MALWSVAILELKSSWNIWPKWCWKRNSWYLSTNVSPKSVTQIRHQHQDRRSIKVNLEQVVRLFWHLLSQWPHGQSAKNYEDHKRPIFHRHFQETIYKADRIFPSLNFKIFQKSSFFAHFSSKSKIFQDHLKVGKHFYCTCIKYIFEINDSVSIIYNIFIWYIYLLRWIQLYFCYLLVFSSY